MSPETLIAALGILGLILVGVWSPLKGRLATWYRARESWPSRPLPEATQADLERIVRRDFPAEQFLEVIAVLEEFDNQWESNRVRVRLAALKLADANLETLRKQVGFANQDFRDVLVLAEYPGYRKATSSVRNMPKKLSKQDRQQIVDADWRQYQAWLQR
jgi:hypothetical protein